ncbi:MAG: J domain-containing protein [Asticcacaulis sp.]|uniref:J domain-containing protein n=1 Tax=Asticcacaulis sp. TaxID=1872648 RepID=UPI0039E4903C
MAVNSIWKTLGIPRTTDRREIRRAYAQKLKVTNPEDDAEGFKALREAYERALSLADGKSAPVVSGPSVPASKDDTSKKTPVSSSPPPEGTPPPTGKTTTFQAVKMRLRQILASTSATDAERLDALTDFFSAPAMDSLDTYTENEIWLARLLLANIPRSDPLITATIEHFKWRQQVRGIRRSPLLLQVLQRQQDIAYLTAVKKREHENHKAFLALTGEPEDINFRRRLRMPLPDTIADLLKDIRTNRPSVVRDLNPQSVSAWDTFFNRPRLPSWGLWCLLATPPCLLLILLSLYTPSTAWRILILPPLILLAATVGMLAYHYGFEVPRWRAHHRASKRPLPTWLRFGWLPITVFLPFLGATPELSKPVGDAFTPLALSCAGLTIILSVLMLIWAAAVGEADIRPGKLPPWLRPVYALGLLILLWLFSLGHFSLPTDVALSAALLAGVFNTGFAKMNLFGAWMRFGKPTQLLLTTFVFLLTAGVAVWFVYALVLPAQLIWALASLIVLSVVQRLPLLVATYFPPFWRIIWLPIFIGFHRGFDIPLPMTALCGLILLAWNLFSLIWTAKRIWSEA